VELVQAVNYTEDRIFLKNKEDIEKVYNLIKSEDPFIITWIKDGYEFSKLIIPIGLEAKLKDGSLVLSSEEKRGGK